MKYLLNIIYYFCEEIILLQKIDRTFHVEQLQLLRETVLKGEYPSDVEADYLNLIDNKILSLRQ